MAIAESSSMFQTETDEHEASVDGHKHKMVGRDTHGREIYTAGKVMRGFEGVYWYVITIERAG